MGDTEQASVIALSVGAMTLAAAAAGVLLRRTSGLAGTHRLRGMARLAAAAPWSVLPPRWAITSTAAGVLAFAGTLTVGVMVTVLIVRAIPPEVPNPTEAYEGFGDAMMALFRFYLGAGLSFVAACILGIVAGSRVASRRGTHGSAEPSMSLPK